ncbi:MAG: DUF4974 domain-containing protein [Parapedobacter sp.]|nr:MAG: DUF4974 domain-containing protein [Parapedobacter sp.]
MDEGDPSATSAAIDQVLKADEHHAEFDPGRKKRVYDQLISEIHERQATSQPLSSPKQNRISWVKMVALWAVVTSIGFFLYHIKQPDAGNILTTAASRDSIVLPDHNQAILTLADGRTIVLSDSLDGVLAYEAGVEIRKVEDGSIFYETTEASLNGPLKYNTFSTPKGSMYQILLPDGTKVWLNTASSIRYPLVFSEKERNVFLTGEAYFEVAHDTSKPFSVNANGSVIKVLGTHFNVSAYADERWTTTTLVEGAVNVSKNGKAVTLKAGQQATVDRSTGTILQSDADVRSAMAWKNGYFRFDSESINDIIEKISRWYDIENVEYRGQFDDKFTGTFHRSKNIAQLFDNLEKIAPIRFEIKERRVVIMK